MKPVLAPVFFLYKRVFFFTYCTYTQRQLVETCSHQAGKKNKPIFSPFLFPAWVFFLSRLGRDFVRSNDNLPLPLFLREIACVNLQFACKKSCSPLFYIIFCEEEEDSFAREERKKSALEMHRSSIFFSSRCNFFERESEKNTHFPLPPLPPHRYHQEKLLLQAALPLKRLT